MRKILLSIIFSLAFSINVQSSELNEMYITCYCPESCPGTITYSGTKVRVGIAAVTKEHIGDCAAIYTLDGDFLGYYECLDQIGTGASKVVDVWQPNLKKAKNIMTITEGKVMVKWIKSPKG